MGVVAVAVAAVVAAAGTAATRLVVILLALAPFTVSSRCLVLSCEDGTGAAAAAVLKTGSAIRTRIVCVGLLHRFHRKAQPARQPGIGVVMSGGA